MAIPVASFTPSSLAPNPGTTVTFTDGSSNTPTSWTWDFGDGYSVTGSTAPTHSYQLGGAYWVSLSASNSSGTGTTGATVHVTNYAGMDSNNSIKKFLRLTSTFPLELPVGTESNGSVTVKEFSPNLLYDFATLTSTSSKNAAITELLKKGFLEVVSLKASAVDNVVGSTAPSANPLYIPGYQILGATAGTAVSSSYSFKMASGATGIGPTGTTASASVFTIDKVLPNSLVFDSTTGKISGNPTGVTGTSGATYTVYTLNQGGYVATPLFITVTH